MKGTTRRLLHYSVPMVALLAAVCAWEVFEHARDVQYELGLASIDWGSTIRGSWFVVFSFAVWLLCFGLLVGAVVFLVRDVVFLVRDVGSNSRRLLRPRNLVLVGVLAVLGTTLATPALEGPRKSFLAGFATSVSNRVDVPAIRTWRRNVDAASGTLIPAQDWPPAIVSVAPAFVDIHENEQVILTWGSGFAHWGILVGPEDAALPHYLEGDSVIQVEPGVYAWYERQG